MYLNDSANFLRIGFLVVGVECVFIQDIHTVRCVEPVHIECHTHHMVNRVVDKGLYSELGGLGNNVLVMLYRHHARACTDVSEDNHW